MFIVGKPTKEQQIKFKVKDLKGKDTKSKFTNLLKLVLEDVTKVVESKRVNDKNQLADLKKILNQYSDNVETSSNEKVLHSMIYCHDDLKVLLDEMLRNINAATYSNRLSKIIGFIKDYNGNSYIPDLDPFAEEDQSKIQNQLKSVIRDIEVKMGKLDNDVEKKSEQILFLENANTRLAQDLENVDKGSFKYKETANKLTYNHREIETLSSQAGLLRKSLESFKMLTSLLSSIATQDKYFDYLKENGYLRKLIKRLYKRPDQIDVMDNSLDLTEALVRIKEEIVEVQSVVKPISKKAFKDDEEVLDDELVEKYKKMGKK